MQFNHTTSNDHLVDLVRGILSESKREAVSVKAGAQMQEVIFKAKPFKKKMKGFNKQMEFDAGYHLKNTKHSINRNTSTVEKVGLMQGTKGFVVVKINGGFWATHEKNVTPVKNAQFDESVELELEDDSESLDEATSPAVKQIINQTQDALYKIKAYGENQTPETRSDMLQSLFQAIRLANKTPK